MKSGRTKTIFATETKCDDRGDHVLLTFSSEVQPGVVIVLPTGSFTALAKQIMLAPRPPLQS